MRKHPSLNGTLWIKYLYRIYVTSMGILTLLSHWKYQLFQEYQGVANITSVTSTLSDAGWKKMAVTDRKKIRLAPG